MPEPSFRFVCGPAALAGAPAQWARDMLREGDIALLADAGGLEAISGVTHALELAAVAVMRREESAAEQEQAVMTYAGALPLVWVAAGFSDAARDWARERGAMTLLVDADGALSAEERRRIDRFVATLGRQSE